MTCIGDLRIEPCDRDMATSHGQPMTIGVDAPWVDHLSGDGPEKSQALEQLRQSLVRNLTRALASHPGVDASLIEDITQDALLRILQQLRTFQGRSRFLTWATTIAIRIAMTELRRRRWRDVSLEDIASKCRLVEAAESVPSATHGSERSSIVKAMYEIINTDLTERQRVVLLGEIRGVPQDELVRYLGTNRNAIYKLGHDARKRLKQRLEDAGFGAADVRAAFVE